MNDTPIEFGGYIPTTTLCSISIGQNFVTNIVFNNGALTLTLRNNELIWGPDVKLDELAKTLKEIYEMYCKK